MCIKLRIFIYNNKKTYKSCSLLKLKSFKNKIISVVVLFTIIFTIFLSIITTVTFFNLKIKVMEQNQIKLINQVKYDINVFIKKVEKISLYIASNFEKKDLIINELFNLNSEISTVLIFNEKGNLNSYYSKYKSSFIYLKNYSQNFLSKIEKTKINYWTDVFVSNIDNKKSLVNVVKKDNYYIFLFISLEELSSDINNLRNDDNSLMIRLFDKAGNFILNHEKKENNSININAKDTEYFTKLINIKKEYEIETFKSFDKNTTDCGMYTKIDNTSWYLLVREDYSKVITYLVKVIFSIIAIIVIFTILAIYLVRNVLNQSFDSLFDFEKKLKDISFGKYDIPFKTNNNYYEFKSFYETFEKMRQEIINRELNLSNSINNFKTLINSTMEGVLIHDEDICIAINESAIKLLGYENKSQIVDKSIYIHIPSKYNNCIKKFFDLKYEINTQIEIKLKRKDKKIIYVLLKDKFINYEGRLLRMTVFLDITEMKEQSKILIQQSKMSSLSQMLSNIAHHWRQPLSAIRVISTGLKFEKELGLLTDERLDESLDKISSTTDKLSKTIDKCTHNFNSNKKIENFSICECIKDAISFIKTNLDKDEITVIEEFKDDFEVKAHRSEFIQAVLNILDNSKDAFSRNTIKDKIIIVSTYKYENKFILSIKDSALGVNKSEITKIFEPYYSTKEEKIGTGIGLYMSHHILKKHLKSRIYAKNSNFRFNEKDYEGLEIIIEF